MHKTISHIYDLLAKLNLNTEDTNENTKVMEAIKGDLMYLSGYVKGLETAVGHETKE